MKEIHNMISVIVPIYNTAKYLEKCVNSILNQSYKDLEILLIDDGSTDDSLSVCKQIQKKDGRIKVFHKENGGIVSTRVYGMKKATGEYIAFIDSDDWIEKSMYEELIDKIENVDLVTSGIYRYGASGNIVAQWIDLIDEGEYQIDDEEFLDNLIISRKYDGGTVIGGISNNLVTKIFKRSVMEKFIDDIDFEIQLEEDLYILLMYLSNCKKVRITHEIYYHYVYNACSVVNKKHVNYLEQRMRFYNGLSKYIKKIDFEEILLKQLQRRFLYTIFSDTGKNMGVDAKIEFPAHNFPDEEMLHGKKIAIFGCGIVGRDYINKLGSKSFCEIKCILDNKKCGTIFGGYEVKSPKEFDFCSVDYILCAVIEEAIAIEMKNQLVSLGADAKRVLWRKPINIWREYFLRGNDIFS